MAPSDDDSRTNLRAPRRRAVMRGIAWAAPTAAIAAAAPALAASTNQYDYRLRTSWLTGFGYTQDYYCDYRASVLTFTLDTAQGTAGRGFAIYNQRAGDGSLSPTTRATLAYYRITVAYPAGMVNRNATTMFTFSSATGRQNWSGPVYAGTQMLTDDLGYRRSYDLFTFTWRGALAGSTSPDNGQRTTPWPGSTTLDGSWAVNTGHCAYSWQIRYRIRQEYSFTTDNGVSKADDGTYWSVTT